MIRMATMADVSALCTLNKYELGYDVSDSSTEWQLKRLLADETHHYLLVYESPLTNKVIGYIHADVYESLLVEPVFNIMALAVASDYHKQGVGKQLLVAVETEAAARHFSGIRLNSNTIRTEAHNFYEHLGYDSHKTQKCFTKRIKKD